MQYWGSVSGLEKYLIKRPEQKTFFSFFKPFLSQVTGETATLKIIIVYFLQRSSFFTEFFQIPLNKTFVSRKNVHLTREERERWKDKTLLQHKPYIWVFLPGKLFSRDKSGSWKSNQGLLFGQGTSGPVLFSPGLSAW